MRPGSSSKHEATRMEQYAAVVKSRLGLHRGLLGAHRLPVPDKLVRHAALRDQGFLIMNLLCLFVLVALFAWAWYTK